MTTFSRINYTDAYYILEDQEDLVTTLPNNEAYGYITKGKDDSIIVHFIKKVQEENPDFIVKGLILPNNSIISNTKNI